MERACIDCTLHRRFRNDVKQTVWVASLETFKSQVSGGIMAPRDFVRCLGCGDIFTESSLRLHLGGKKGRECLPSYLGSEFASPVQPSAMDDEIFMNEQRHHIFNDLAELYWFRYLGETLMIALRAMIERWVQRAVEKLGPELRNIIGDDAKSDVVLNLLRTRMDFFDGLRTEKQVYAYASKNLTIPRYHETTFPGGSTWYTLDILDWVVQLVRRKPATRRRLVEVSNEWKSGVCLEERTNISRWYHGLDFKKSAFAAKRIEKPGEPTELLIGLGWGFDEAEPLNVLGQGRGEKKFGGCYASITNLPPVERFDHDNMALLGIGLEKVMRKVSATRVFAGANPETGAFEKYLDGTIGAQYRRLVADPPVVQVCRAPLSPQPSAPSRLHSLASHATTRATSHAAAAWRRRQRPAAGEIDFREAPPLWRFHRPSTARCDATELLIPQVLPGVPLRPHEL